MKENLVSAKVGAVTGRITRSRAAALGRASSESSPIRVQTSSNSNSTTSNLKASQRKTKAVLQDVTNIRCESTSVNCFKPTKAKSRKRAHKDSCEESKMHSSFPIEIPNSRGVSRENIDCIVVRKEPSIGAISEADKLDNNLIVSSGSPSTNPSHPHYDSKKSHFDEDLMIARSQNVIDIDSDKKNPLLCSIYAPDIYNNLRVAELLRRPDCCFMETVQQDITKNMRGILIDWLVEVSEEYSLASDTLYITVYLTDLYLSQNYIERQRLQLLGITCMLVASKYEELCPPGVDELCFMTDNTYTREEVLKMEVHVLKYFGFRVYTPTTKTFLSSANSVCVLTENNISLVRRFLLAAQATCSSPHPPSVELKYLANYLAELTLIDYDFLSFLPSIVAASAVFLAKWTLDDSCHPWNPTLEYYTRHKASDLKTTVSALQDLQVNAKGCTLSAIRTKYKHQKFKGVANLSSTAILETLF